MLGGYLEFFMKPGLAGTYLALKRELDELIQMKVNNLVDMNLFSSFMFANYHKMVLL